MPPRLRKIIRTEALNEKIGDDECGQGIDDRSDTVNDAGVVASLQRKDGVF